VLSVPVQVIVWKLERLVSEMTCYVSSGTQNSTHLLSQPGQHVSARILEHLGPAAGPKALW